MHSLSTTGLTCEGDVSTQTTGPPVGRAAPARTEFMGSITLVNEPLLASMARTFVSVLVKEWGYEANAADVALIVSELFTNAVVHTRDQPDSRIKVCLHLRGSVLRVEVHDGTDKVPEPRAASPGAESGRGLHIVEAIAVGWGCDSTPDGKYVWCEVEIAAGEQTC